jgi:hypothetical protein
MKAPAPSIDESLLGPLLTDMVRLVGWESTLAIVERWGGTRLWFPTDPNPESELTLMVGMEKARRLSMHFGADRPSIPKALAAIRAQRDAEIRANPQGLSVPQLSRRYGVNERSIYQIRAKATAPTPSPLRPAGQGGLFE